MLEYNSIGAMFRKLLFAICLVITIQAPLLTHPSAEAQLLYDQSTMLFFYGKGCPHCAKVEAYFSDIRAYDSYRIEEKEIYFNRDNAALFSQVMSSFAIPVNEQGVPTLVAGSQVITGDQPIIEKFEIVAQNFKKEVVSEQQSDSQSVSPNSNSSNSTRDSISLWVLISASLVDAINPCAFAVLFVLLSTVLAQKNSRKRIVLSGLTFTAAIFISYFLMGLGVYSALASASSTNLFTKIVGILAIVLGLFNLKDWLWYGKTPPMEVPMSWRPKMIKIIERVTSPIGAFIAGILVSLFLLPCTSGPYIVVLGLLADNPFEMQLLLYLLLYNAVFVLPMLIITFMVAQGTKMDTLTRLREEHIDKLHLIAGLLLISIGLFVLFS